MEPYSVLAIPRMECGEMDVYATTQGILKLHVSIKCILCKHKGKTQGFHIQICSLKHYRILYVLCMNCVCSPKIYRPREFSVTSVSCPLHGAYVNS